MQTLPVPRCLGEAHPILDSVLPVVRGSRDVTTDVAKLAEHARWLAYEELPFPRFVPPFGLSRDEIVDFVLVANLLNFAYTDFETGVRFDVVHDGAVLADADALLFCLRRAFDEGIGVLNGAYLAEITVDELRHILRGGTTELQMLEERAAILRDAGAALVEKHGGSFHTLVASASPKLYDGGHGMLEVLIRDVPRFDDVARYDGHVVRFHKLAQLAFWMLHVTLPGGTDMEDRRASMSAPPGVSDLGGCAPGGGGLGVSDLDRLAAFADYIVPVGLRAMEILRYSDELERAIDERRLIEAGSPWEVELRAHTIYATALLTDEVNRLRPPELQVIVPQIDARFWVAFHKTHRPHHLTKTIYY